jgi:putative pyoverdin transport system ATP-binding/permease protein
VRVKPSSGRGGAGAGTRRHLKAFIWNKTRRLFPLVIVASVLSGLARAGLVSLIHEGISAHRLPLLVFALLCAGAPLVSLVGEVLSVRATNHAMYEVLTLLVKQVLRLPLRKIEEAGSHRLLNTMTQDLATVTGALRLVPAALLQFAMVIGCVAYLAFLSPPALLAVVAVAALGGISFKLGHRSGLRHMRLTRHHSDAIYRHLETLVMGIKELKLNPSRTQALLDGLAETATSYKRHSLIGSAIYAGLGNWGQLLVFALMGLLLFASAQPAGSLDQAIVTGYGLTLLFMIGPFTALMSTLAGLGAVSASAERLERLGIQLLGSDPEPAGAPAPERASGWRKLELREVSHGYRAPSGEKQFDLGPLSMTLTRGELLFVAGGNGSGKTTLAKLLCGLYHPEAGEIRLDGRPVATSVAGEYRSMFSVVFSDFYLFERLTGVDPAKERRARELLERFGLAHKVTIAGGGFSTTALSQGQRKRLALLAACLEDRSIFILDEWAADQDPSFKRTFYQDIVPSLRAQGKTLVVISHDDRYYRVADRILKLDSGKVVYDGSPGAIPGYSRDQFASEPTRKELT